MNKIALLLFFLAVPLLAAEPSIPPVAQELLGMFQEGRSAACRRAAACILRPVGQRNQRLHALRLTHHTAAPAWIQ